MKKYIISTCILGLGFSLASAQPVDRPGGPPDVQPGQPPEIIPGERPEGPDRVISPEILELRTELRTAQAELNASRAALRRELGNNATAEERLAALEQWHVDNAGTLAQVRVLQGELAKAIRDTLPRPMPIEVPDDIAEKQVLLQEAREALAESRQALIASLGEDASPEVIRAALEQWRADNAEAIEASRALAEEIRKFFRDQRPDRPGRPISEAMQNRREDFRANANAMREARKGFAEDMSDPTLTPEQRRAMVEDFRAEQRENMRERAELRRQERLDQTDEGGDRRPGG